MAEKKIPPLLTPQINKPNEQSKQTTLPPKAQPVKPKFTKTNQTTSTNDPNLQKYSVNLPKTNNNDLKLETHNNNLKLETINTNDLKLDKTNAKDPILDKVNNNNKKIEETQTTDPKLETLPPIKTADLNLADSKLANIKLLQVETHNPDVDPQKSSTPNISHSDDSVEEHNYEDIVNEIVRNVYLHAPLKKHPKTFVTLGDDGIIRLVKTSESIHTNEFYTLVNVRIAKRKSTSEVKIVKAGSILPGKSFHFERQDFEDKLKINRLKIEGVGKDASTSTDENIKAAKETTVFEKIEAKVVWISGQIFDKKKNIKIQTATGMKILLSLNPPHHETVEQDECYSFIRTQKTDNWTSSTPVIKDVALKLQTIKTTEIIKIARPSRALRSLNKIRGEVLCIAQKLSLLDQCRGCNKTKFGGQCRQPTCTEAGVQIPPNKKFVATMVIKDQENKGHTVEIWSDQLKDMENYQIPEDEDLTEVLILTDLEKLYKNQVIYYKKKYRPQTGKNESIYDVTLDIEEMDQS